MANLSHSWIQAYRQAIEETNREELHQRVLAAETAIFNRLQELAISSNGHAESAALEHACGQLVKINTQRLK